MAIYIGAVCMGLILIITGIQTIKKNKKQKKAEMEKGDLAVVESYMSKTELKMLSILNHILPKDFIALPKVGLGHLLEARGQKNLYEKVSAFYVDFVIFDKKEMKPALLVDIFDNSFVDDELLEHEPSLKIIFDKLSLNFVSIYVKNLSVENVKKAVFEKLGIKENDNQSVDNENQKV